MSAHNYYIPAFNNWPLVINDATEQDAGVMSAADKAKLDSLSPGGGGDYKVVADIAARDAIAGPEGIHVFVLNDGSGVPQCYRLLADLTTWVQENSAVANACIYGPQTGGTVTIYVRPGGNDTTGDGTLANPYLTRLRAEADIPFITNAVKYVIDMTGIFEVNTVTATPKIAIGTGSIEVSTIDGESVGDITYRADPVVLDTVLATDVTSTNNAAFNGLITFVTTKAFAPGGLVGKFLKFDNGLYYPIQANTATDISICSNENFNIVWPATIVENGAAIECTTALQQSMYIPNTPCAYVFEGIHFAQASDFEAAFFSASGSTWRANHCQLGNQGVAAAISGGGAVQNDQGFWSCSMFGIYLPLVPGPTLTNCYLEGDYLTSDSTVAGLCDLVQSVVRGPGTFGGAIDAWSFDKQFQFGASNCLFDQCGITMIYQALGFFYSTEISNYANSDGLNVSLGAVVQVENLGGSNNGAMGLRSTAGARVLVRDTGCTISGVAGELKVGNNPPRTWTSLYADFPEGREYDASDGEAIIILSNGATPTSLSTMANVVQELISVATPVVIATYTPLVAGNYTVRIYYTVTVAPTTVAIDLTFNDAGGAQSVSLVSGAKAVQSYSVAEYAISVTTANPIVITATMSAANRVYVSATLEAA